MRKQLLWLAVILLQLFLGYGPLMAQNGKTVTLKAHEGNFVIKGALIKYNDSHYVLKSKHYGVMTVDVKRFACTGPGCPKAEGQAQSLTPQKIDFGVHGSNTVGAELMPLLIEGYAQKEKLKFEKIKSPQENELLYKLSKEGGTTVASIDLKAHGSSSSFSSLSDGTAQIGMSSRPIKSYEKEDLKSEGTISAPQEYTIALDAIAVIVSQDNALSSLSLEQIAKIYSGEIKNWSELGQLPGKINVYARDENSGTFDSFKSLILKPYGKSVASDIKRFSSNEKLSKQVVNDPRGIGFVGFANVKDAKALSISNRCGIKRAPTEFNVKTLEYPLTRKLFLYTTDKTKHPVAQELIKFATSKRAEKLIKQAGFISKSVSSMSFRELGDILVRAFSSPNPDADIGLLKNFVETFQNSKRLTTTFRFKPNSVFLEPDSAEQIIKLGRIMFETAVNKNKIYLVGFSDSAGDFEQNRLIARLRAEQVKNTIVESFGNLVPKEKLVVKSYSELLPVDCNNTAKGRHKNRRVEVWLPE